VTDPTTSVPAAAPRRPTGRITALIGVAAVTTLAVVALVALTRPPGGPTVVKGAPVPEIKGTALDGSTVDLAGLRGKPVVINFWASWCGPCREEMPLLAQKAAQHADSGLQIVGVLSDDTADNGRAFETQYGATWPSVFDADGAIKQAYQVIGRPQSYFVDRNGILRSIQTGYLTDADFERQFAQISGGS
jgi:cytochrome c biogenesis protein CcmG, thiol:disulfide interchange protein DsbE